MSTTTRNVILSIVGIVVGFLFVKWAIHVFVSVLFGILPLALVVGGIYVAYQYYGRKALGGGRRTLP